MWNTSLILKYIIHHSNKVETHDSLIYFFSVLKKRKEIFVIYDLQKKNKQQIV